MININFSVVKKHFSITHFKLPAITNFSKKFFRSGKIRCKWRGSNVGRTKDIIPRCGIGQWWGRPIYIANHFFWGIEVLPSSTFRRFHVFPWQPRVTSSGQAVTTRQKPNQVPCTYSRAQAKICLVRISSRVSY